MGDHVAIEITEINRVSAHHRPRGHASDALSLGHDGPALEALLRFARVSCGVRSADRLLGYLADACLDDVGADAVAVFRIAPSGELVLAASRHLTPAIERAWTHPAAGERGLGSLRRVPSTRFRRTVELPIACHGDPYGLVVLLYRHAVAPSASLGRLAEGLTHVCALGVSYADRVDTMARVNDELRASREVLMRASRLRAIGEMCAGVSHDLKNLLDPISAHLQLIDRAVSRGDIEAMEASLTDMQSAVRHGVQLIDRLEHFGQPATIGVDGSVCMDDLAREAVALARARLLGHPRIDIHLELASGERPVSVNPEEAIAALVSLIFNAIDAMAKGTVVVKTGSERGAVWVSVSDDGPGMSAEVERRAFDPFFTTKGDEGTGLGLAMVQAFADRHGGTVTLLTAPGAGARFTLTFPTDDSPVIAPPSDAAQDERR